MRSNTQRLAVQQAVLETLESRRLLSLAAPVSYAVGTNPLAVATADFNGDGRSDVVTANQHSNTVSVLLSNANGTLQPAQNFATGAGPRSVAVGDVNNDGKRDIITANGGNLSVLLGNGNGTFQPASSVVLPPQFPPGDARAIPREQAPVSVAVGDVNGDGKLDLAVNAWAWFAQFECGYYSCGYAYWPAEYVNVLLGNDDGTFETASSDLQTYQAQSIGLADFNGDNKLDVVTATNGPVVRPGNGDGTLQPPIYSTGFGYAPEMVIGDFDNDAELDLVTRGGSGLNILKGQGDGTFQVANSVAIPFQTDGPGVPGGGQIRSVVAGDVNGDGKLDLVVNTQQTVYEACPYYCYNPTTTEQTQVLLGFGDNTFSLPITSTLRSYAGHASGSNATALADLNGDSRPDVIATERVANAVTVQLNDGNWVAPVGMRISDATAVTEGHAGTVNAVFTVTLDHAADFNVSVEYSTANGSAIAGGDFVATSGTLSFAPGDTSKLITVQVKGDRIGELDEQFHVNLTGGINAAIIDGTGIGTILDDEPRVSITSAGSPVTEGDSGTAPMLFTATLSAPSSATVTVDYGTRENQARAGKDFVAVTDTLTFLPGQTSKTFTVPIVGDLIPENDETFYATLSGASGALVQGFSEWAGLIHDNDPDPSIVINNVSRAEGNVSQTLFEFTLTLQKPSEKEVSVNWATASGSASSSGGNKDYQASSGSAYFYPGQMTATVQVYVYGDTRSESDETFFVNLSSPFNATIADAQGVGTILNDETRGKRWVGAASGGSWSTAGNWSPSGVPVSTSLVTIAGASVTLSSSASVSELDLAEGATLTLAPGGNRVLRTPGLFIDYSATLNLNDNDLIVDYTAGAVSPLGGWSLWGYTGIAGLIGDGNSGRLGYGTGITSSSAAANPGLYTLGVAEASQVLGISGSQTALWNGVTVDASSVLVKYTYAGDLDLDGDIDGDDFFVIDSGYASQASGYANGDFDYNGRTDADDYFLIDSNYNKAQIVLAPPIARAASVARPAGAELPTTALPPIYSRIDETLQSLEG